MKKTLYLLIGLFLISMVSATITCNEVLTRDDPVTATDDFDIIYTASNTGGKWGVIITESLSGPCTFSDGTISMQEVLLSEDGDSLTKTILKTGDGDCVFTGDYNFGDCSIVQLPQVTVLLYTEGGDGDGDGDGDTGSGTGGGAGGGGGGAGGGAGTRSTTPISIDDTMEEPPAKTDTGLIFLAGGVGVALYFGFKKKKKK